MLKRFAHIRWEFGALAFGKTIFLLVALAGLSTFGILVFASWWALIIVVAGLAVGWLVRRIFVEYHDWFTWAMPGLFIIYLIVLSFGRRMLNMAPETQLLIITIATVFVFNSQFWSLSDPDMENLERYDSRDGPRF